MVQQTRFLDLALRSKSRVTRREIFLAEMDRVVPWAELVALIEPVYPKGQRGRPPIGVERMLRLYFIQLWNHFSDAATEDALSDMPVLARLAGIDLTRERVPDATTLMQFRHVLEAHDLAPRLLERVNALLDGNVLPSIATVAWVNRFSWRQNTTNWRHTLRRPGP
jgi:IS5 family transposase